MTTKPAHPKYSPDRYSLFDRPKLVPWRLLSFLRQQWLRLLVSIHRLVPPNQFSRLRKAIPVDIWLQSRKGDLRIDPAGLSRSPLLVRWGPDSRVPGPISANAVLRTPRRYRYGKAFRSVAFWASLSWAKRAEPNAELRNAGPAPVPAAADAGSVAFPGSYGKIKLGFVMLGEWAIRSPFVLR
jgi:hypothetical protein